MVADLSLDDGNGTESVRSIRRNPGKARVLIMTGCADRFAVAESLREGAAGYVPKAEAMDHLVETIEVIGRGGRYFPRDVRLTDQDDKGSTVRFRNSLPAREGDLSDDVERVFCQGHRARLFISSKNRRDAPGQHQTQARGSHCLGCNETGCCERCRDRPSGLWGGRCDNPLSRGDRDGWMCGKVEEEIGFPRATSNFSPSRWPDVRSTLARGRARLPQAQ